MGEADSTAAMDRHLIHPLTRPRAVRRSGPVVVVSGEGAEVVLESGQRVIDGTAGLWCVNVGHGRGELADAAADQMRRLAFTPTFGGFSSRPAAELAARLAELAPDGLSSVMLTSGGGESNETAFKLARAYWTALGRPEKSIVLSHDRGYHGLSHGATAATRLSPYRSGFGPLAEGFERVSAPYSYRCDAGVPCDPGTCPVCTGRALEERIAAIGEEHVAAFIAEPVLGTGGVIVPPEGYLRAVADVCRRAGVLFIADEVITGFGRTGRLFGVDRDGVIPDLMSFAKGVTSGYLPLGGVLVHDRVWEVLVNREGDPALMHGFTYSGHPVSCAVALRNLQIIEDEQLVEAARARGERLAAALAPLRDLPEVGEVRSIGLMAGIELVADRETRERYPASEGRAQAVVGAARRQGLLARALLDDIVMLAPPFVISEQQVDAAGEVLASSIVETSTRAAVSA